MQPPIPVLGLCLNRGEQLIELNPMEHLRPNAVDGSEGHLGSVLRRIDVHPKRALAEGALTTSAMASTTAPTLAWLGAIAAKASWILLP
jgi:hypothetical protein